MKDKKVCLHCKKFKSNFQEGTTAEDVFKELQISGKIIGVCVHDGKECPMFSNEECILINHCKEQ